MLLALVYLLMIALILLLLASFGPLWIPFLMLAVWSFPLWNPWRSRRSY